MLQMFGIYILRSTNEICKLPDKFLVWHNSGVASCNLTYLQKSLTFLSIIVLKTVVRQTIICVVYSDLKKRI